MTTLKHAGPFVLGLLTFISVAANGLTAQTPSAKGPTASVDPFIGTGRGPGGPVNLFPGATTPFGMVQLSPDTEDRGFGYHYDQDTIRGFSMTHMSGVGCANEGDMFFMPTTGPIVTQIDDMQSPYSHKLEAAAPGYYQVQLLQWDINAELSATDRTGIARFTFPAGKVANLLVPISHTLDNVTGAQITVTGDRQIEGFVEDSVFCGGHQTYKVYFVMTFDRPFSSFGTWSGAKYGGPGTIASGSRSASQSTHDGSTGAYATWAPQAQPQTITARIAISYVDPEGAQNNLKAESTGKDFSEIRDAALSAWNRELSVIDVSGGSATHRKIFYTALYHSLMMPSIFNDADGRYLGFDDKVHQVAPGHLLYANYSGWDIYRSEIPLLAMIEPHRMEDMAQSIVLTYQQGGWIDRWPQVNRYTNVMAGSPLTVALANAWLDGLHGFDIKSAWEGMYKDATQAPPPHQPYAGEEGIDWINKLHYVPDDKVHYGSVSQLQEDTIAYASLYRLAVDLGKTDDAKTLYDRALYYRNLFDPTDRYFRPRNADGQWVPDFNPALNWHGFIEGTGWHYQWLAPSDMAWLVNAVGRDQFNQRLTEFFDYKIPAWYAQYYNPYNETDLQAPFEFNFSGEPWESQRVVRRVLDENYTDKPDGVPGNDDCGEMSSWAVLSMMGIYSVDPASLAYELVGPVFPKVVVHLQQPYSGKSFTIEAEGNPEADPYIQRVQLNGKSRSQNWISFQSIAAGGTLRVTAGAKPNHSWGSAPSDAPPSLSDTRP
ncbi:MAG TPA: GH92 family glycosyl hydrolase [Acidobacteriaceae bacterium]|nr:GH92 family glycosyl hydrolase [Acidobacteriaceae bacterium]